jgi:RNA polymerase sigma factor for flagellar operon FliA
VEVIDTIKDESKEEPLEKLEKQDVKKELQQALSRLPEREKMILTLYYHENMTLKEIGEAINVSESRVCQLHAQAIVKLKNLLNSNNQRLKKSIV